MSINILYLPKNFIPPQNRFLATPLIVSRPSGLRSSSRLAVLGPVRVLYVLFIADLAALIEEHGLSPYQYADDTQIYGSCSPSHVVGFSTKVSGCVNDVLGWMRIGCN